MRDDQIVGIRKGCALDKVFRILSGEWTTHILWILGKAGPMRHGELRRQIEGISSKVLTDRLRMLEAEGVIFRDYKPTVPPEVSYGLTDLGHELDQTLQGIDKIAAKWPDGDSADG